MSKLTMRLFWFIQLLFLCYFTSFSNADYNVLRYGAKADGKTDATQPFLRAWAAACNSTTAATITVPKGRYLLKPITFGGPCKNKIVVKINATIVAPTDYRILGNSSYWILFTQVSRISVFGGYLDAKGASLWACKNSSSNCPAGARSMSFNGGSNILVSGLTSVNSQLTHLVINRCNDTVVKNVKLYAPDNSPNTDGIHVMSSNRVTIRGCTLQTGDDCISIGAGTKTVLMNTIKCGPGHGISIGSMGKTYEEEGVEDITLSNAAFIGSDNGVRIKSWARASKSYVKNVLFQNILMTNVKNPIIIDQNYCPSNEDCPNQTSGVKVSGIAYKNIKGTSRSEEAVTFDCSPSQPCSGIKLQDIKLTYMNQAATATCKNVGGTSSGVLVPASCL